MSTYLKKEAKDYKYAARISWRFADEYFEELKETGCNTLIHPGTEFVDFDEEKMEFYFKFRAERDHFLTEELQAVNPSFIVSIDRDENGAVTKIEVDQLLIELRQPEDKQFNMINMIIDEF